MDIALTLGIILLFFLFLSGAPLAIAFCIGGGIIALFQMGLPVSAIAQIAFASINSYPLLAMPFFILAGNIILRSGGMEPLRDFMQAMVGHWPGGLAVAAIIFSAFLGSISGSAAACLAILGIVMVPILVEAGYDRPFASGLAVTSAELGLLIPPSLFFIIFGALNRISIADLFLAGIGPGVLCAILMSIYAVFISKKRKYAIVEKSNIETKLRTGIRAFPVLLMPFVVLGGIYSGIFSPTQAASVSVVYAILIGTSVYRRLSWPDILEAAISTVKLSSMIYIIIIGADLVAKIFAYLEAPQAIAELVVELNLSSLGFLFAVEVLLLVMGFFFSSIMMLVVVLPVFLPSVYELGIDPVLYGTLAMIVTLIGEVTPPMGPQLWLAAPICEEKMGAIARESWGFLGAMVLATFITTLFPSIALFLVKLIS
jgi:C4-dicarboxylate transporter DctM subunit